MTERTELRALYGTSFVLRLATGMLAWMVTKHFGIALVEDATGYESIGAFVAEDWMAGRSSLWMQNALVTGGQAWLMVGFVATFYYITAGVRALYVLLAVYCLISAIAPVYTYKIGRQLGCDRRGAMMGAWVIAVSPAFLIWSGALYKEGFILVVLNVAVYHSMRLQEHWRASSILALAVALPAMYGLRFYLAYFMAGALGVALLFGKVRDRRPGASVVALAKQGAMIGIIALAMFATGFHRLFLRALPTNLEEGFGHIQISRNELATFSSGYLPTLAVSTPGEALRALPVGFAYFMAVPLPWQGGSLRQDIAIPETLMWLLFYPIIGIGIKRSWQHNRRGTLLIVGMVASICVFYALFVGNIGTAYRLRIQVWLLLAVFIGWGWESVRKGRRRVIATVPGVVT